MKKLLTLFLLIIATAAFAMAIVGTEFWAENKMLIGIKITREAWASGTYICEPNYKDWKNPMFDSIYKYSIATPTGEFWQPTTDDLAATDYKVYTSDEQ